MILIFAALRSYCIYDCAVDVDRCTLMKETKVQDWNKVDGSK